MITWLRGARCSNCGRKCDKHDSYCPGCGLALESYSAKIQHVFNWTVSSFLGTILGLLILGCLLEFIIDNSLYSNGGNPGASLFAFVGIFLVVCGYPVIGAIVGEAMGTLNFKRRYFNKHFSLWGMFLGFVVALLAYILIFLYAYFSAP
jgi:hypothetical protein